MDTKSYAAAALIVASLTACGIAASPGLPPTPTAGANAIADARTGSRAKVVLRIVIPHRRRQVGVHYISPATRSMAIAVVSSHGTTTHHNVDLTPATNPNCNASGCTVEFSAVPGHYTYELAAFDGLLDAKGHPTGHELSADLSLPVRIQIGRRNVIGVTLDGIPSSIAIVPSPASELFGNGPAYALSKCYSHTANQQTQSVNVLGVDADKNYILGPGAPSSSLTSDDPIHLAASAPSRASPDAFLLSDPTGALPNPNSVVHLTAKVTPATASGGIPVTESFTITFDASICGVFTQFPLPTASSFPNGITTGSDGALWFAEGGSNKIGRITTAGAISEIATSGTPTSIAAGPQNTIWFTQCASNQLGQVATSGGTVFESHIPTSGSFVYNVTSDPHGGYPWFTETIGNNVATLRPSGLGIALVHETPVTTSAARPFGITGGPDGAIWFTEESGNNIGRISGGTITNEYPIPTSGSAPEQIAPGPDGALWFTEGLTDKIGRVTTGGAFTEYPVPTLTGLEGIAAGPDGAMWFTEVGAQKIGRITMSGTISEFPLAGGGNPDIITQGPDGAMWFTLSYGNAIVRMQ